MEQIMVTVLLTLKTLLCKCRLCKYPKLN